MRKHDFTGSQLAAGWDATPAAFSARDKRYSTE
jgi:hypothetical protein